MTQSTGIRTYSTDEKLVQERRNHIARCAITVFLEKGYRATTIRELAKACGMAQGAIYYYIGAKEDILHLIVSYAAAGGPLLRQFLAELGDIPMTEALVACIKEYYTWADNDQENYIFFNREIIHFSSEDRAGLLRSQAEIIALFEELLKKGVENGEFKADSPFLIAHNVVIQGFEWAIRRWYLRNRFTLRDYTESETRLLLKQLGLNDQQIRKAIAKQSTTGGTNNSGRQNNLSQDPRRYRVLQDKRD